MGAEGTVFQQVRQPEPEWGRSHAQAAWEAGQTGLLGGGDFMDGDRGRRDGRTQS